MNSELITREDFSTTAVLLNRIKGGDDKAITDLIAKVQPVLTRWAHGRLPMGMRATYDTHDFVQEAITRSLSKLETFKSYKAGAFLAYLRQILVNCINEQFRKKEYRNHRVSEDDAWVNTSRLLIDPDLPALLEYEQALDQISEQEKNAIILRLEFGLSFQELADELDKPSANAARMYVSRALVKLAEYLS